MQSSMEKTITDLAANLGQATTIGDTEAIRAQINELFVWNAGQFVYSLVNLFKSQNLTDRQYAIVFLDQVVKVPENLKELSKDTLASCQAQLFNFLERDTNSGSGLGCGIRSKALGTLLWMNPDFQVYQRLLWKVCNVKHKVVWLKCLEQFLSKSFPIQERILKVTTDMFQSFKSKQWNLVYDQKESLFECFHQLVRVISKHYPEQRISYDNVEYLSDLLSGLIKNLKCGQEPFGYNTFPAIIGLHHDMDFLKGMERLFNDLQDNLENSVYAVDVCMTVIDRLNMDLVSECDDSANLLDTACLDLFQRLIEIIRSVETKEMDSLIWVECGNLLVDVLAKTQINSLKLKIQNEIAETKESNRSEKLVYLLLSGSYYGSMSFSNLEKVTAKKNCLEFFQIFFKQHSSFQLLSAQTFGQSYTNIIRAIYFSLISVLWRNGQHFLKYTPDIFDEGFRFVTKAINFKLEKYDLDALRDLLRVLTDEGAHYFSNRAPFKRLFPLVKNYILPMSLPKNEYNLKDIILEFGIQLMPYINREEQKSLIFLYYNIITTKGYRRQDMECVCGFLEALVRSLQGFDNNKPKEINQMNRLLDWIFTQIQNSFSSELLKPLSAIMECNPQTSYRQVDKNCNLLSHFCQKNSPEFLAILLQNMKRGHSQEQLRHFYNKVVQRLTLDQADKEYSDFMRTLTLISNSALALNISPFFGLLTKNLLDVLLETIRLKAQLPMLQKLRVGILQTIQNILKGVIPQVVHQFDSVRLIDYINSLSNRGYQNNNHLSSIGVTQRLKLVQILYCIAGLKNNVGCEKFFHLGFQLLKPISIHVLMKPQNSSSVRNCYGIVNIYMENQEKHANV